MNTLQMEFLLCQALYPFFSDKRSKVDTEITFSRLAMGEKRLREEFWAKMDLWITFSRLA